MCVQEAHQPIEWRVALLAAEGDLLLIESDIIMLRSSDHRIVLRRIALDNDFASHLTSTCSACYLGQDLEGALGGVKVGEVKPDIGIDYSYQRHQGYRAL